MFGDIKELLSSSPTLALASVMAWFALTKMKAYDKHLVDCGKKESGEAVLSYRVGKLELSVAALNTEVHSNHDAVMEQLAKIPKTRAS